MNTNFDRLEARLRSLFEKKLPKLFTGHQPQLPLVEQIIDLMRSHTLGDDEGSLHAPDKYIISVSPEDLDEWQLHQDILDELTNSILEMGTSLGLIFSKAPQIELEQRSRIAIGTYMLTAHFSASDPHLSDTAALDHDRGDVNKSTPPENAILIIDGKTTYPLNKPVINIGRHSNNDLVLTNPHVSRHHAQLRVIKNHYVVFDVGSMGGLFLNNRRVSQATLHAGDVLRIGAVNLIYNQEPTSTFQTSVFPVDDLNENQGEGFE
ncbi:MAG: DUF3662 domain-containing protein [Chloroflexi bacterium]|nr:DUF3662 domain-containing protein [Chloroflexota bacterium]